MKDRDIYTPKHPSPVAGVPAFVAEEATGVVQGDALKAARRKRTTEDRVERLEDKVDTWGDRLSRVEGTLETIADVLIPERREAHKTTRARIDSRTKIILAVVGLIGTALGLLIGSGCA
jgi:hypothetical protein